MSREILTILTLVTYMTWFLEDNFTKQSRDHCQSNYQKSQKPDLYRILQENFSKP